MDTLTVIARAEYDGTTVVCVAQFNEGRPDEESIPVTLSGLLLTNYYDMIAVATLSLLLDEVSPKL